MLWGDNTETAYTDKVDKTVASSVASVTEQQGDVNSLLNTYLTFTRLRNTYPALAEGGMEQHPVYNSSNANYDGLGAWYMTKEEQKMLVLHNFGGTAMQVPLTDNVEKAVGVSGKVEQYVSENEQTIVRLGAYASAVFLLAE